MEGTRHNLENEIGIGDEARGVKIWNTGIPDSRKTPKGCRSLVSAGFSVLKCILGLKIEYLTMGVSWATE